MPIATLFSTGPLAAMACPHPGNSYVFSVWNNEGKNKKLQARVNSLESKLKKKEDDTKSLRDEVAHMTKMFTQFTKSLKENVGKYESIHIHYDDPRRDARDSEEKVIKLQKEITRLSQCSATDNKLMEGTKDKIDKKIAITMRFLKTLKLKEEADVEKVCSEIDEIRGKIKGIVEIAKSKYGPNKLELEVPPSRYIIPFQ